MITAIFNRKTAGILVMMSALMMGVIFFAAPAEAITIVPDCARNQGTEAPQLSCALETFTNIANIILGLTGSFALLMFVYGGFVLLSSGGNQESVTKGKTIIRNSVIGILIIMLSGYMVRYAIVSLRGSGTLQSAGEACGEEKDEKGKMVTKRNYQIGDQTVCARKCSQIPSYSCTTETVGKTCLIGLCTGSQNRRCCPN